MMDETDRPSSPDSFIFQQRQRQQQQQRPLNPRHSGSSSSGKRQKRLHQQLQQRYRGQTDEEEEEGDSKMPLVVPKVAFTMLDRFVAPETQDRAVSWGVNFAAEKPWMSVSLSFSLIPTDRMREKENNLANASIGIIELFRGCCAICSGAIARVGAGFGAASGICIVLAGDRA